MIGEIIGHYQITQHLGSGGMGEVYKATDTNLRREVALKFLPEYLAKDEVAQKRFIREARSAAAIDHPYICKIYEVGEAEGKSFIAMEYVEGQTLKEKMLTGRLALKEVLQIAFQIAGALDKAHKSGVVHRDLKPDNIMLTPEGHVKVMDFGLAKRVEREEEEITAALTREGTTLGTLTYMSPEQLRGQPVDQRSDIFSFGVLLYEMLTGIHPFRTGTQAETINSILNEHPSPLSRYIDESPALLQHTLEKMLTKDAEERYQSIREVATNLKKMSEGISVSGMTWVGESAQRPAGRKFRSRLLKWALGTIAAAVIAVVAVDWLSPWWQRLTFDAEASSVAILPLTNMSEDPEYSDHLAQGISRGVIEKVGQVGLRVTPWQTVQRFASSIEEPQEIAQQLQVKNVLHGSFEDQEEQIVVSLTLKETDRGLFHWIEEFQEPYENLFRLEQRIAARIATSLKGELTTEEKATLAMSRSRSLDAYENYLTGAHLLQQETQEATELAADYFARAIELDPGMVAAHVGLAGVYLDRYYSGWSGLESLELARKRLEAALELDPSSMMARREMITYYAMTCRTREVLAQWQEASTYGKEDDVQTLLTRARAYVWSPLYYERAVPSLERVIEIDPLNQEAFFFLLQSKFDIRHEEAIELGNDILKRFGEMLNDVHFRVAIAYQLQGDSEQARRHYERSMEGTLPDYEARVYGGILLDEMGERAAAERIWQNGVEKLRPYLDAYPTNVRLRLFLACYYGLLKDDNAFLAARKRALRANVIDAAFQYLATVHARRGEPDRAIELIRHWLQEGWVLESPRAVFTMAMKPLPQDEEFIILVTHYETQVRRLSELH